MARLLDLVQQAAGPLSTDGAARLELLIRSEFGGQAVYVHRRGWFDRQQRDARIVAEHSKGRSARRLAKDYRISRETVNKIVRTSALASPR